MSGYFPLGFLYLMQILCQNYLRTSVMPDVTLCPFAVLADFLLRAAEAPFSKHAFLFNKKRCYLQITSFVFLNNTQTQELLYAYTTYPKSIFLPLLQYDHHILC